MNPVLAAPTPNVTYSACLIGKVEEMIVSGRAPYPVQRTLLVSGMLERCLESRLSGHRRLETPELNVCYQAPEASNFCGAPEQQTNTQLLRLTNVFTSTGYDGIAPIDTAGT